MMFRLSVSFAVFCVLCCKFSVLSYPQGAPIRTESCINLQPIHMDPLTSQQVPNQQGTTRPYRILVSQQQYQTCTSNQQCGLQPLQVSIQGQGGLFRGFIVQARTPNGGSRSWGQFIPLQTGDSKVIQCQNGLTLTHTANNDKNIVRFAWIPEPGMREQVQFVATVVQNLRTIYPGVYSAQLRPVGVSAIRVFNNAPFKTAGIISFVTSVIAILL